jgi:hypothetical protein
VSPLLLLLDGALDVPAVAVLLLPLPLLLLLALSLLLLLLLLLLLRFELVGRSAKTDAAAASSPPMRRGDCSQGSREASWASTGGPRMRVAARRPMTDAQVFWRVSWRGSTVEPLKPVGHSRRLCAGVPFGCRAMDPAGYTVESLESVESSVVTTGRGATTAAPEPSGPKAVPTNAPLT